MNGPDDPNWHFGALAYRFCQAISVVGFTLVVLSRFQIVGRNVGWYGFAIGLIAAASFMPTPWGDKDSASQQAVSPMRFRKLRIAWSVFWGLAAVLLVVLWVRSYWWWDTAYFPLMTESQVAVQSKEGSLGASSYSPSILLNRRPWRSGIVLTGWGHWCLALSQPRNTNASMFGGGSDQYYTHVRFPHWLPILLFTISAAFAVTPSIRWRFSLRSLLIAATLVAVVLGLIVVATR